MYRTLLLGLFVSCTVEPAVGRSAAAPGDTKPIHDHEIQSPAEASAVAHVLTELAGVASTGTALRGVGGTATVANGAITFDDFELRASGGTMTLAGDLLYRRQPDGHFALDGVVDVQWSAIADTVTLHDHELTTQSGLTVAF